jgi:hypothetical protein
MARKNRFFRPLLRHRLPSVDRCALSGETASFEQSVSSRFQPGAAARRHLQESPGMKKTFAALVAVATIAGSLAATPASAQRGVAAGVAAGLIGGAIAASRPAYAAPAPVYVDDYPACRLVRERFWDGYGWRYRRIEVCN